MIDIHHHLLPGVDDGAKDEVMTLEMLKIAVEEGITKICATPHYILGYNQYEEYTGILEKVQRVNELAQQNNLPIEIYPGNEVFIDSDIENWVLNKKVVTMNHSKYLLVETSMSGIPDFIDHVLYQLQLKGIAMILAHPERYRNVQKDPNRLIPLIEKGMLVQVNVGSIMGFFGEESQRTAENLIKHNMVHFVATDAHSNQRRAPRYKEAYQQVAQWIGQDKANLLFIENPQKVISDQLIGYQSPREVQKQKKKRNNTYFSKILALFRQL